MRDLLSNDDPVCEDYNSYDREKLDFLDRSYYDTHLTNNIFNTKTSYIPTDSLF